MAADSPINYPPALGIYNPNQLPATWDPAWSQYWKYDPRSVEEVDKLRPANPFNPTPFTLELVQKDDVVATLEKSTILTKASPQDLQNAYEARAAGFGTWPRKEPSKIYRLRWAIDRFKSEPGSAVEITRRWGEECYTRNVKFERKQKIWAHQLNLLQNSIRAFFHKERVLPERVFQNKCPGWIEETEQFELERLHYDGMNDVIAVVQQMERTLQAARRSAENDLKNANARLERERKIKEQEEAAKAKKEKDAEEARLREEEKKRQAEEADKKRAEEQKERDASAINAQMSVQAKIAAYQVAVAELTAQLQAGKISGAEYGAQMGTLSQMLK